MLHADRDCHGRKLRITFLQVHPHSKSRVSHETMNDGLHGVLKIPCSLQIQTMQYDRNDILTSVLLALIGVDNKG
jgi:hypothetical protein